mgnify:CR=1 FL=1
MRRDEWKRKLEDLYVELGQAKSFLVEAEKAVRSGDVDCAKELIQVLLNEISNHRCKPWWSQLSEEIANQERETLLT